MQDPRQALFRIANEESRHATACYFCDWQIIEIDIDFPNNGARGHVMPEKSEALLPDGLRTDDEKLRWIDERFERKRLEGAIICRAGAGDLEEWFGPGCAYDREAVQRLCPDGIGLTDWNLFIERKAAEILTERFNAAATALAGELLRTRYDKMSGDRAFEIIRTALAEYDREEFSRRVIRVG